MSTLHLSDCRSSSSLFRCQFEQTTLTPFDVFLSLSTFFSPRSNSILPSVHRSSVQLFHIYYVRKSSLRVISERQMRHVIPSAINRLLQYFIFQLHINQTRFNHLDECIFRFRAAERTKKKTATKTTDAHFNLPSVPTMHMFKYHWLLWDRMGKNEKKFKFRNNKKHSAWTHRTSERLILFFFHARGFSSFYWFTTAMNPCQCQYKSQYVTHTHTCTHT